MSYEQQYTNLDGTWHAIGLEEHTVCGLEIPHGNGYSPLPDGETAHCGPDVVEEVPAEAPAPKAKAKKG